MDFPGNFFRNNYVILLFLMTKYDFLLVIVIFLDNFEGCPILTTCSSRASAFTTRTTRETIVPLVRSVHVVK